MSTSNSSRSSQVPNRITDDELNALIFKLQTLLPHLHQPPNATVSATKVLKETCSYIKRLQKEVDGLSERLSQCLDSMDLTTSDAEILRNLLHQQ